MNQVTPVEEQWKSKQRNIAKIMAEIFPPPHAAAAGGAQQRDRTLLPPAEISAKKFSEGVVKSAPVASLAALLALRLCEVSTLGGRQALATACLMLSPVWSLVSRRCHTRVAARNCIWMGCLCH